MSQRRQDTRRAKQERRREQRHDARVQQRRTAAPIAPRAHAAPTPVKRSFWTIRNKLIAAGVVGGLIVLIAGLYIYRSVTAPLPGEKFPSAGNAHLADIDQPHAEYTSNPPTSGPHMPTVPRPGIYTQDRRPEDLGHFMEHGGVWILYDCPQGCEEELRELTNITNGSIDKGRPVALSPYSRMDAKFAVTAWQYLLTQDTIDVGKIEDFVSRHSCRYNPEGGPYCTGVRGKVDDSTTGGTTIPVTVTPFSVFGGQSPAPSAAPATPAR